MLDKNESIVKGASDVAQRDTQAALAEAKRMVDLIMTSESEMQDEDRRWIAGEVSKNVSE